MDDDVIPFLRVVRPDDTTTPPEPEAQAARVAQQLRELARLAEQGQVAAVGVVVVGCDGLVRTWFDRGERSPLEILGAARVLESDVMRRGLVGG
jgi:hypothetical protein